MIKTDDFRKSCDCRSIGECYHNPLAGIEALNALVDAASEAMKAKLRKKYLEGYHGWDEPKAYPSNGIVVALKAHVKKGDWLDVMNFAAMLWNRQQPDEKEKP